MKEKLESMGRKASMAGAAISIVATSVVYGACAQPETVNPPDVEQPAPKSSYDFAESLGLEVDYLRELHFDDNAREFITSLSSLPEYMRSISLRSGLTEELLADNLIDANELGYFNRVMKSYMKEIETMQPWLDQIPEKESLEALALNLSNFMEADEKGELFNPLRGEQVSALLSGGMFYVDGKKRKYEDELLSLEAFQRGETALDPYATAAVRNITQYYWSIHNKAWEVSNNPDYDLFATDPLAKEHFRLEAVGSTDSGVNAYEDIKLLAESGSPAAKAALRLYAWNLVEGRKGSAPQVRVPLTMTDAWSVGIDSIAVVIAGHDVPAIRVTDEDIALLKERSPDPLLILDIDHKHYLPFQWTRKSILRSDVDILTLVYTGKLGGIEYKIPDLKPY